MGGSGEKSRWGEFLRAEGRLAMPVRKSRLDFVPQSGGSGARLVGPIAFTSPWLTCTHRGEIEPH
jgi:hypothetical protein